MSNLKSMRLEEVHGEEVLVKVYSSNKKRHTFSPYMKVRGKQEHDAKVTAHLGEDDMKVINEVKVVRRRKSA